MFSNGVRTDIGQFSRDVVGSLIGEYSYLAKQLTDRRWTLITDQCGIELMEAQAPVTTSLTSSGHVNRRTLYEPSSSVKGSDEY